MNTKKIETPEYWRDAEIIGYVRKSVVLGETDRIGEVKQREAIERECRALQLPAPTWYSDVDGHRSGRHEHTRPGWRSAKARYLAAEKSVLVVYELDRTNRNVQAMAELVEAIRAQPERYRLVLVMNRYDSARDGWGAREIKTLLNDAVAAQYESDKASERMRATIAVLRSHGLQWGKIPYGFQRVGRGLKSRLTPNARAQDVRDILTMYARGDSYTQIADAMNLQERFFWRQRTVSNPDPEPVLIRWAMPRLRKITFQSMMYCGYLAPAGHFPTAERIERATLAEHAQQYSYVKSESIEPIIDEQLAESVLRRRLVNRRRWSVKPGSNAWPPMLSGLLWCGERKLRSQQNARNRWYRTREGLPAHSWECSAIDAEIISHLSALDFPAHVVAGIRAALAERTGDVDAAFLQARLTKMKTSMLDLERRFTIDGMDESIYRSVRSELAKAIDDTQRKLAEPSLIDAAVASLQNLGAVLQSAHSNVRWRALWAMFERIELAPGAGVSALTPRPWARDAFYALQMGIMPAAGKDALPEKPMSIVWERDGNTEPGVVSPRDAAYWLFSRIRIPQELYR